MRTAVVDSPEPFGHLLTYEKSMSGGSQIVPISVSTRAHVIHNTEGHWSHKVTRRAIDPIAVVRCGGVRTAGGLGARGATGAAERRGAGLRHRDKLHSDKCIHSSHLQFRSAKPTVIEVLCGCRCWITIFRLCTRLGKN